MTATSYQSSIPFPTNHINTLAIYCSDGRFADQVNQFLHDQLNIDYCDRMVVPGGPGILANHDNTTDQAAAVAQQMQFLITAHEIQRVVMIFHEDCGYYKACVNVHGHEMESKQQNDLTPVVNLVQTMADDLNIETYMARIIENRVVVESF